jgi:hypothetical protein
MTKAAASAPEYEVVAIKGVEYKVRELTVGESDKIEAASTKQDGTLDGKLSTRLAIEAATDPTISADDISSLGQTKYTLLIRAFNKMNTLPEAEDGKGPNDQSPTG